MHVRAGIASEIVPILKLTPSATRIVEHAYLSGEKTIHFWDIYEIGCHVMLVIFENKWNKIHKKTALRLLKQVLSR